MAFKLIPIIALTCLLQTCLVHSLYFHIKETERKCFIEEVPDETLVVGELANIKLEKEN